MEHYWIGAIAFVGTDRGAPFPVGYTFGFVSASNGTRQMEARAEMLCAS